MSPDRCRLRRLEEVILKSLAFTPRTVAGGQYLEFVKWFGGDINKFVTGGGAVSTTKVATSSNGLDWSNRVASEDITTAPQGVAWSPTLGRIVVVGDGTQVLRSDNAGETWAIATITSRNLRDVIWVASLGLFIAVGHNCILSSVDGVTWTLRSSATGSWRRVAWSPVLGLALACAHNGTAKSSNGTSWALTASLSYATDDIGGVVWSEAYGKFFVTGNDFWDVFEPFVLSSEDSSIWDRVEVPYGCVPVIDVREGFQVSLPRWFNLVTFGLHGPIMSEDGFQTWRRPELDPPEQLTWNQWRDITYSPELDLVVACAPVNTNNIVVCTVEG